MTSNIAGILGTVETVAESVARAEPAVATFADALAQAKTTGDRVSALESFAAEVAEFLAWIFPQHGAPTAPRTSSPTAPAGPSA
jgi:hypothetical protein